MEYKAYRKLETGQLDWYERREREKGWFWGGLRENRTKPNRAGLHPVDKEMIKGLGSWGHS